VSGCDLRPGPATRALEALGARVAEGHDPAHVAGAAALVVTAAVPADHAEIKAAERLGIPVLKRAQALGALVNRGTLVAVAGTHGKTTTTAMTTEVLAAGGLDPTGFVGGRVAQWGSNLRLGSESLFVVEADEYDQAFLTLHPTVAVVNNVEPDHLECYGSLAALEDAFVEFAGRAATRIVNADDPGARRVGSRLRGPVRWFGFGGEADLRITEVAQRADSTEAVVVSRAAGPVRLRLRVPGVHNLCNAVAALGAVEALGGSLDRAAAALAGFSGVGRRFERLGEHGGVAVVDDYAHHPSELAATLAAARQAYPGRRLVAVFQPHLYSRTEAHGAEMGKALAAADLVIVTEIYGAREQPIAGVSGRLVAEAARDAGADARFESARDEVSRRVFEVLRPGDVVLILGAGDITRVGPELVRWLNAA
jgi:UDP-N-acetylmuramate--alanine ligase